MGAPSPNVTGLSRSVTDYVMFYDKVLRFSLLDGFEVRH
jgi:hypothetical protein